MSHAANVQINPSDETIRLGPLAVRFLITGEDATGSVALFELTVPAAERLAAAGSGVTSLLAGIASTINVGQVQSNLVEFDQGFLFTMSSSAAGPSGNTVASILVLGSRECDPEAITYQLAIVVDKFADMLASSAVPRPSGALG